MYLDVGDSNSRTRNLSINDVPIPASVTAAADFDLKSTIWTFAGSYRVVGNGDGNVRRVGRCAARPHRAELAWTFTGDFGPITPPPRTGSRNASVDQWDAIVGGKGRFTFGADHKWAVPLLL